MKRINWSTVSFYSLIVIALGIRIGRHVDYGLPKYSILIVVIVWLYLTIFHQTEK